MDGATSDKEEQVHAVDLVKGCTALLVESRLGRIRETFVVLEVRVRVGNGFRVGVVGWVRVLELSGLISQSKYRI